MVTVTYACGGSPGDTVNQPAVEEGLQDRRPLHVLAHAWPLPTTPQKGRDSGVRVLVAGSGRSQPLAKHSSWLRDRRPLDELKAQVRL